MEIYSSNNQALLKHIKTQEIDPYKFWNTFATWAEENDRPDLLADYDEDDPEQYYNLDPEVRAAFDEYIRTEEADRMKQYDPVEAPTWSYMDLNQDRLLKPDTWLIHFSDHAYDVAMNGFKHGADDITKLGLTTYLPQQDKKYGGYNFAFTADSRHALWAVSQRKYGREAVMFQHGGVDTHHYGDEENQIIFYGPEVDARSIVYLANKDGTWCVMPHPRKSRQYAGQGEYGSVYYNDELAKVIAWVKQNYRTYAKVITGW